MLRWINGNRHKFRRDSPDLVGSDLEKPKIQKSPGAHLSRLTQFENQPALGSLAASRSQHGAGTIKAILWTVLLIYGAFVAYKILPAYVAEYQLQDKMQEQAQIRGR